MTIKQHKVVVALPIPLEPDSIYYVRNGGGFDIHVTNNGGVVVGYELNVSLDKVDKVVGESLIPDAELLRLATVATNATKNATDASLRDRSTHTGSQPINTVEGLTDALDSKVDKVVGKKLTDENFTEAEKSKLAGLESSRFKGVYSSLASLQSGVVSPQAGDYADVDNVGADVVRYIYDATDSKWVVQQSATSITSAQIKQMYESNPDTNSYSDDDRSVVSGITAELSTKVDKVSGKGLSDTNYTQAEKTKLADIALEATKNRADNENADKVHTHTTAQVTGLGTAATKNVGDNAGDVMEVGTFGYGGVNPVNNTYDVNNLPAGQRLSLSDGFTEADAVALNLPALGGSGTTARSWHVECVGRGTSRLVQNATEVYGQGTTRGRTFIRVKHDATWHLWEEVYTTGNTLNLGKTAATARTALELTGEWVDLRPYLKTGFYWDPIREGRNAHPRIRKLSCGRVELDGVVSFNETSGPRPIGVFVNVPAPFRPSLTAAGLTFADSADPLSFGQCNWIVIGEVEYSPPAVHGDVSMIPVGLPDTLQDGALTLSGMYWFT